MQAFIISDLHLGNRHCRHREFVRFLEQLPDDAALILNGDTIDYWHQDRLPKEQQDAFRMLVEASHRRPIVWLRGNNDRTYSPPKEGRFEMRSSYEFGRRLYVAHGNRFESIMPALRPLLNAIRALHHIYAQMSGGARDVAAAAKRIPRVYSVLTRTVARNAARFARRHGYAAVACGHTHFPEDRIVDGIRYINTGAWTELPLLSLHVTETEITCREIAPRDDRAADREDVPAFPAKR